jgi:Ni/Fe-hydrogenase subunit HybB-like protein
LLAFSFPGLPCRAFAFRRYAAETRVVAQSVLNSDFVTALRREAWDSHLMQSAFVFAVLFSGLELTMA